MVNKLFGCDKIFVTGITNANFTIFLLYARIQILELIDTLFNCFLRCHRHHRLWFSCWCIWQICRLLLRRYQMRDLILDLAYTRLPALDIIRHRSPMGFVCGTEADSTMTSEYLRRSPNASPFGRGSNPPWLFWRERLLLLPAQAFSLVGFFAHRSDTPALDRTPPPPVRRHHQIAASGRDP